MSFLKEHLWDVHEAINYSKYSISVFKVTFGYIEQSLMYVDYLNCLPHRLFGDIIKVSFRSLYCVYIYTRNEKTVGNSWTRSY